MRFPRLAFPLLLASLTLLLGGRTVAADDPSAKRLPNIVYIMADDLGYAELGSYGQKWIKTPNIDRIAKEGMKFTDFYAGNAVCAPCRCNLMTGKHPGHAYVRSNARGQFPKEVWKQNGWEFSGQTPIPDEEVTIAELLKEKGYATAAIGKWGLGHFGTTGDPNKQGFDLFYGFNDQRHAHNHYPKFLWRNHTKEPLPGNDRTLWGETYSQDRFVDVALKFIDENQEKPFFLYLPFAIPHLSIQGPKESYAEYEKVIPEEDYKHTAYLKHPKPRAAYAGMITHMDMGIGQIMERIEKLGLDDDTIIFFTSDNGPTFDRLGGSDSEFFESAGPFRGLKGSLHEGGIRVPMVVRWPGKIASGTVTNHISAAWDTLPTLCELVDQDAPEEVDGLSFLPTLLGKGEQKTHPHLYWEFPSYGGQQTVRMGKWKGIRTNLQKELTELELYDLSVDPGETNDLAEDHPELVEKIKQIMQDEHVPMKMWNIKAIDGPLEKS